MGVRSVIQIVVLYHHRRCAGSVVQEDPEQLADKDAGDVEMVPLCPLFLDPRDLGGCLSKWPLPGETG